MEKENRRAVGLLHVGNHHANCRQNNGGNDGRRRAKGQLSAQPEPGRRLGQAQNGGLTRRRFCIAAASATALPAAVFAPAQAVYANAAAPRKWAVLAGVSALKYTPSKSLIGPRNDIPQMRAVLTSQYGFAPENVSVLENEQATRADILRALQAVMASARPDDFVLFYYSGHGVLCPPPTGDTAPPGTLYKAFVPCDAQLTHGKRTDNGQPCPGIAIGCEGDKCDGGEPRWETLLAYRDVSALLRGLPTKNVLALLDCCHSGIAARGGAVARRWVNVKARSAATETAMPQATAPADALQGLTTLTACSAEQTAKEWPFLIKELGSNAPNNGKMGALTYHLLQATRSDTAGALTGAQAFARISSDLLTSDFDQTPEAEGYLSRPLFGPARVAEAAADNGVNAGPPAKTMPHSPSFPTGETKLRVGVFPVAGSTTASSRDDARTLTEALTGTPNVAFTSDPSAPRDVEIEVTPTASGVSAALYRAQVRLPETHVAPDAKGLAQKIRPVLQNLLALQILLDLKSDGAVWRLDAQVNGQGAAVVPVGGQIALTVRAERACYLYAVDTDPQGKVTVLFPNRFVRDNRIPANQTVALPAPQLFRLTVQGPPGPEAVKLIATLSPLTLPVLFADTGEFTALGIGAAEFATRLTRELREAVRAHSASETQGWAEATVFLRVVSAPVASGAK